jgi:hypothetical protein
MYRYRIEIATLLKVPQTTFKIKLINYSVRLLTCVPQTYVHICQLCDIVLHDVARHILTSCARTFGVRECFWQYVTSIHHTLQSIVTIDVNDSPIRFQTVAYRQTSTCGCE